MTVNENNYAGYDIIAGEATSGDANNNSLTVSEVDASSAGQVDAGFSYYGDANHNTTVINNVTGGSGTFFHGGYGGWADGIGNAEHNVLNFHGGYAVHIHGGHAGGDALYNTANFYDGEVNGVIGAGFSNRGSANYNTLNVYGGMINGETYGGTYYGTDSTGDAIGNTVNIYGGTIIGDVYGGWAPNGNANDNTINIYGSPDLSQANIHAGNAANDMTGNALNIRTKNITAINVDGFNNINFYLPSDISAGDTVLTLTDSGGTDLTNTSINPTPDKGNFRAIVNGSSSITTGDKIKLITNENGNILIGQNTFAGSTASDELQALADSDDIATEVDTTMSKGVSMDYDLHLMLSDDGENAVSGSSGKTIVGTVGNGTFTEPDFPNTVPVYIMQNHIPEISPIHENTGYEIFLNMGGGNVKIKTGHGTHIKTKTGNYDFGIARNIKTRSGNLIFAPVIEYGHGAYDTLLRKDIDGDGNASYIAGGVIARMNNNSGFYYEGSFRAGRADTKFTSDSFMVSGQRSHVYYHTDAPIIATHARIGHQMQMGKDHHLDIYGIYSYARQGSSSTDMSTGEHYNFSSVDGSRFRAGYRLTSRTSKISRLYSGLAYQYDTSVDSISRWNEYSSAASGESGSSGMLELGWKIMPIEGNNWHVDINATGWVGHQKGAVAMAKLKKAF